jgi:Right handed beta helix region
MPIFVRAARTTLVAMASLWLSALALAATYYVDTDIGRDSADGLSASNTSATAGPWQSLARVTAAPLVAGDQVLLRCGQTWQETLVLNRGGTSVQPIVIGAYPFGCTNKPVVGGSSTPQDDEWEQHSGNIYRMRLPVSVLPQGRMRSGVAGWRVYSPTAGAKFVHQSGCEGGVPCGAYTSGRGGGLLISPSLTLRQGQRYTVRYNILAPAGAAYGASVRRFAAPYNMQSGYSAGVGTGAWQSASFSFVAPITLPDARVDIDVPGGGLTTLVRDVRVEPEMAGQHVEHLVTTATGVLNPAAHPNRGFNANAPQSQYYSAGSSGVVVGTNGRTGSNYVVMRSDVRLPSGAAITPGLEIWLRTQAWSLRKHSVTSVSQNLVYLDTPSAYPMSYPGWGYFFTGALWMLDSPGEWFYDRNTRDLYVWMPDGAAPGRRIGLGLVKRAVTIGNPSNGTFPSNITLENLAFQGTAEGLQISRMQNITLRNVSVSDIGSWGLYGDGANGLRVENSSFSNTRADAILAIGSNDARILNNEIVNSGVIAGADAVPLSLPRENYAAVMVGARSIVSNNRVTNAGYIGLLALSDSTISDNVVQNFSLTLNDSGGIYGAGAARVAITGNLIRNGVGDRNGIPSVIQTLAPSIYLDGNADAFTVRNNVLAGADYCIQLHDAYNTIFENNLCHGARRSSVWLQESSRSRRTAGDTSDNLLRNNALFQTASGPSVILSSAISEVSDFASFDGNRYSTLASPVVAQESSPGYQKSFTLAEWQLASTLNGPRNLEPNGRLAAPLGGYARGLLEANAIPSLLVSGWSLSGGGTANISPTCGPAATPCMLYTAPAAATGYISSQRFSLTKGRWYRVSFDAAVNVPSQRISLMAMRSGPTYENLMGLNPFEFSGSTAWKRYSFYFQATADALVTPTTAGARVDFMNIEAGNSLRLANFELNPVSNSTAGASFQTVLTNPERSAQAYSCPLAATLAAQCSRFFDFPSGQRVTWPVVLQPRQGKVVFTQDDSLPDSDGDGIADSQDQCPATAANLDVNAVGCPLP